MILFISFSCKQEQKGSSINQDISVQKAAELSSKGFLYVDLRTKKEIDRDGKIDGSIHIDYKSNDFDTQISLLPKDKKYIAYCASGGRSSKSLATFNKYNIEVYNMLGGYGDWKKTYN